MNLTDDETLKFQSGCPVLFYDVCAVYPAKMRTIVEVGYSTFQKYLSILIVEKPTTHSDAEVQKLLVELTTFQYLLMMTAIDPEANQILHEAFKFFTHEDISISLEPAQIIVGPIEEKHLLTEENFYEFQHLLKRMYFIEQEGEEIIINANDSPAVRH